MEPVTSKSEGLSVSALICTADRPQGVVAAIESILRSRGDFVELIIVDQGHDEQSRHAIEPFLRDARVVYIRSATKGKGHALNIGIERAKSELVAITDDDCEVNEDWPNRLVAPMQNNPNVALTYGQVLAGEHDELAGFIPTYVFDEDRECRGLVGKVTARGIGANTALRRRAIQQLGGFDSELGPGGRFYACLDGDMTVRALLAGYTVYETTSATLIHHGFRTWAQGHRLAYRSFFGIAAAYAKPVRCGRMEVVPVLLVEFFRHALVPFARAAVTLRRPFGWQRVKGFCDGLWSGFTTPIDRQALTFRPSRPRSKHDVETYAGNDGA